jgi:hypothetical protein
MQAFIHLTCTEIGAGLVALIALAAAALAGTMLLVLIHSALQVVGRNRSAGRVPTSHALRASDQRTQAARPVARDKKQAPAGARRARIAAESRSAPCAVE